MRVDRRWLVLVVAVAPLLAACPSAPRVRPVKAGDVNTGPGSLESVRRQLQGTWELVEAVVFDASGKATPRKAEGRLTYDEYGNLTIGAKLADSTQPETSVSGLLAYSGRAVIDPAKSQLVLMDLKSRAALGRADSDRSVARQGARLRDPGQHAHPHVEGRLRRRHRPHDVAQGSLSLREYLDTAVALATDAGAFVLSHYQRGIDVELKARSVAGDRRPTSAPSASFARVSPPAIRRMRSSARSLAPNAGGASHRWFVDPIDGTRSFVHGVPLFGVLLGLRDRRRDGRRRVPSAGARRDASPQRADAGAHGTGVPAGVTKTSSLIEATIVYSDCRISSSGSASAGTRFRPHGSPARVGRLLRPLSGGHRARRRDAGSRDEPLGRGGARADSSGERRPDSRTGRGRPRRRR